MTARSAPDTAPQNMLALRRANEVRLARARLRNQIANGTIDIVNIIQNPPIEAQRMNVLELLSSQYRWGKMRCRRALVRVPLHETKLVGDLTDRQRHLLGMSVETINQNLQCMQKTEK